MEFQEIVGRLGRILTRPRFDHSQGVSQTAMILADRFGGNGMQARIAGILHDCAREIPSPKLIEEALRWGIKIGEVERQEPVLLHAPIGAKIAEIQYGVRDKEVLEAIKTHTVGGKAMSVLAKIIYLADFIEPGRNFPGVDKLRAAAENDLNEAVLTAYDHTIQYIIKRRGLIHPATVEGRNELLKIAMQH